MPYYSRISPAVLLPMSCPSRAYRVEELGRAPLVDREVTALLESGLSEGSALLLKSRDQRLYEEQVSLSTAVKRTYAPLSAEANWLLRASLNMVSIVVERGVWW